MGDRDGGLAGIKMVWSWKKTRTPELGGLMDDA